MKSFCSAFFLLFVSLSCQIDMYFSLLENLHLIPALSIEFKSAFKNRVRKNLDD